MNRFIILLILIILVGFACREEPTKPPTAEFTLTTEDIGVTDVFFRLKATLSHGPFTVLVRRNGELLYQSQSTNLNTVDTLLYDENLLPKQNYAYKAYYAIGGVVQDSSAPMVIKTMDTTSHNIIWETFYLGEGASGVLYDVAIVNDTLVYAVGEINVKDSLGNWINPPYNFVKWDGREWKLSIALDTGYGYSPNYAILAFSENDIWAGGTFPKHWNGNKWTFYGSAGGYPGGFYINKIWGTSSSNLYIGGTGGNIVHYDSVGWWHLESGTTLPINDIYGAENSMSGKWEILAVASEKYQMEGKKLLRIEGLNCNSLSDSGLSWSLSGLWFVPGKRYYVVGGGIHRKRSLDKDSVWQVYPSGVVTSYYSHAIRGNSINDVWVGGAYGELVHFNGYTWHNYTNELARPMVNILSIAVRGNLVVAVGYEYAYAVVIMGRRKM